VRVGAKYPRRRRARRESLDTDSLVFDRFGRSCALRKANSAKNFRGKFASHHFGGNVKSDAHVCDFFLRALRLQRNDEVAKNP
jgi:hypothetical protein